MREEHVSMRRMMRSPLFLMALTIFIDFTGFGLVIPLLPFWSERLGANALGVGAVLTAYALAQFLFTPLLGALSDRHGRRPVILCSLMVEAFGFALTGLAGTLPVLLLARFVGGIGASNVGSAQAVIADVTAPEERARGMGAIGAAIGLGFVVGPALGGALVHFGQAVPFWVAMCVALGNAALVARLLPETRVLATRAASDRARVVRPGPGMLVSGWRRVRGSPAIARLIAINLLFTLAFTGMETVVPLLTQRAFGWRAEQNGYLFTYIGVVIVVMQGGLVGRLARRLGEQRLLIGGLVALALGLALLAASAQLGVLLVALAVLSIGEGAVTPSSSALLSGAASGERQGETLGLAQGVGGLGRIIGPLVAGALFTWSAAAPFLAGSVCVLVGTALAVPALPALRAHASSRTSHAPSITSECVRAGEEAVPARPSELTVTRD